MCGVKYFALFLISIVVSKSQNIQSPCSHIFRYEVDPKDSRWTGVLALRDEEDVHGVFFKISLNDSVDVLSTRFGLPRTKNNKDYIISNENFTLPSNTVYFMRFRVKYNVDGFVPVVKQIRVNGRMVCPRKRN